MKILIVDDDGLIRDSLKMMFSLDESFQRVETAENGQVALDILESYSPDVVVMDIRMPVMDGVITTKVIKEQYPHTKVMVLTTFNDREYLRELVKVGVEGYLLKSTGVDQIIEAVKSVESGHVVFGKEVSGLLSQLLTSHKKQEIPEGLTPREVEIIEAIGHGKSNREIAEALFIGEGTVRNYITVILDKLSLRDRTQLAIYYLKVMESK